jgi:ligand-binding sensor domain-containing protein/two-component sensor histidine kinase
MGGIERIGDLDYTVPLSPSLPSTKDRPMIQGFDGSFAIRRAEGLLLLLFFFVALGSARASNSVDSTDGYLRTVYTSENGLPDNRVNAIVQTENGFLWVGTDGGLARFDGYHFTPIHIRGGLSNEIPVQSLSEAPNGDLWVGTDAGLAQIPKIALDHFDRSLVKMHHPGVGLSDEIMCFHIDRRGVVWIGTNRGMYSLNGDRLVPVIPVESISRIEGGSDGQLLIITGHGLVEWNGTRVVAHPELASQLRVRVDGIFHVFDDSHGVRWSATEMGVARSANGVIKRIAPFGQKFNTMYRVYEDRAGSIWVAGQLGLFRVTDTGLLPVAPVTPGLQPPRAIYSDRDGNLWVALGDEGLIRLKKRTVRMYTTADGLPGNNVMAVLSSHDGTVWVGNSCGGLSRFDGQRFRYYQQLDGFPNSCVWALAEDTNHDIWVGTWGGGISRFHNGHFTNYSLPEGLPSTVALSLLAARDGSLWIGTLAGMSHMQNGHFRNYTTEDGLSSDRIVTAYQDAGGGIWAGTSTGIDRLVGDHFIHVDASPDSANLPYNTLRENSFGILYALSVVNGIDRIQDGRVINIWRGIEPMGMVESKEDDFWFSSKHGIFRVSRSELQRAEQYRDSPIDYLSFGTDDGLNSSQCSIGQPNMTITPDGRLWVATVQGLAMLDIRQEFRTNRRPNIIVGTVSIDGKSQFAGPTLSLPPGSHHVELHYDAVNLASPEKVRLQYRMDGVDTEWLNSDSTRTAIYTNIPYGSHAFHIRATDSDGVWDRTGLAYEVTQQPYFYQKTWFRFLVLLTFILFFAGLYLLHVRQIVREVRGRLEERMNERERIARDLHDTLLQGFQGIVLRIHSVTQRIPTSDPTHEMLESALERADQVIAEGRDRVMDLRETADKVKDLAEAFAAVGLEFAHDSNVDFKVGVEGKPQLLHPIVQDEIFCIGREAVVNAFNHAQAKLVEINCFYGFDEMLLRIRDDGRGIEKSILAEGRKKGHWGLLGMRERAQKIGSRLVISCPPGMGTEVELRVPGVVAYVKSAAGSRLRRFIRKVRGG